MEGSEGSCHKTIFEHRSRGPLNKLFRYNRDSNNMTFQKVVCNEDMMNDASYS
jgi:hypothetical protein